MRNLLLIIVCLCSLNGFAKSKILYGEDDRLEFFESIKMYQDLSKSTAAMFDKKVLISKQDHYEISSKTLLDEGVCETERYVNQPVAATCSGFLVSDDLIVTAGHCMIGNIDCEEFVWVFDYKLDDNNDKIKYVDKKNVYNCKQIVEKKFSIITKDNYALIQLDRKVIDRTPLRIRKKGKIEKGRAVVIMGYPNGLPLKIADNANVLTSNWKYFTANLDAFSKNAGSPVIDTTTGIVEGVYSGTTQDYVLDGNCKILNKATEKSKGVPVSYITNIKALREK